MSKPKREAKPTRRLYEVIVHQYHDDAKSFEVRRFKFYGPPGAVHVVCVGSGAKGRAGR